MDLSNERKLDQALPGAPPPASPSWITRFFFAFLCVVFLMVSVILFQEGKQGVLLIALIAGAALWMLEALESRRSPNFRQSRNSKPGSLAVAGIITLVAFIACLPTLHIYFLTDEFALIHAFHQLTPAQFLQLLHMDTRQFVSGDSRQEFRPLYSLFYFAACHLWGLRLLGYHLCEIFFHAMVSVLVFLIVKALAPGDLRRAGFAGILFAVQPPHAQAMSLIVGLVAESLPALLYLSGLLYFIRFRSSGQLRHLVISIGAYTVGLLSKESAVTLPLMLFSYDLFRIVTEEDFQFCREKYRKWERWRNLVLPYTPYVILLFVYLAWRHRVLASYLRESNWGNHVQEIAASPEGFWLHFSHFASRAWQLQVFNFQTLFPYSAPVLGIVLGLILTWSLSLLRHRRECRRSIALVLYFGLVWYLISNLPYLIEEHVVYHLYLPAAGLSIGIACLALPVCRSSGKDVRYSRLLGMILLVAISVTQMWKGEAEYARVGEMSARMTGQLEVGLKSVSKGGLVVLWPGNSYLIASGWGEGIVPFSVQPPFSTTDLTSNIRVIEHPDMSCCGVGEWWKKIGPMLDGEMTRPAGEEVAVHVLWWDESTATFKLATRVMQRQLLIDRVTAVLGGPPESVESIDEAEAIRLVKALADMVREGGELPQQK